MFCHRTLPQKFVFIHTYTVGNEVSRAHKTLQNNCYYKYCVFILPFQLAWVNFSKLAEKIIGIRNFLAKYDGEILH